MGVDHDLHLFNGFAFRGIKDGLFKDNLSDFIVRVSFGHFYMVWNELRFKKRAARLRFWRGGHPLLHFVCDDRSAFSFLWDDPNKKNDIPHPLILKERLQVISTYEPISIKIFDEI